ncbi:MAG: nickel pincer cofactor biosynthesis protein LarC [Candidatus Lokiarchaeota archaeon]|nr:nickel pincer cofactor biosynthesis protein LarC [Candidatus Lokiarchaeota archaeon]
MNKAVIVDCQTTGISGDKFLASLIDIGGDFEKLNPLITNIIKNHPNCKKFDPQLEKVTINHFKCTKLNIKMEEESAAFNKKEVKNLTDKISLNLPLSDPAKKFISSAFEIIFDVEASIHGKTVGDVHLHEISSADTFFDIIGSALLIDNLNFFENTTWIVLPIAVGSGDIRISHGVVKAPAPATLKIIKDHAFIMKGTEINSELTTPTGVTILAALKSIGKEVLPRMKVDMIGYGGGKKMFETHPNVMRLIAGHLLDRISARDEIVVLETNVDDVTGEIMGNFINKMSLEDAVKDISVMNTITKKNRPGYLIKILVLPEETEKIKKIMFEELGTLGIRNYLCERSILKREIKKREVYIEGQKFIIRIKEAQLEDGSIVNVKPEFEDIKIISNKIKKPFNQILKLINNQIN